jgi:membrane-bound metal-dependent hydrolase YbcI (DUF457 family)
LGLFDQSPTGLPSESVGAPRPRPRQFRRGLRNALPSLLGLALFGLVVVLGILFPGNPAIAGWFWLTFAVLVVVLGATRIARLLRLRRARRFRPPSREG